MINLLLISQQPTEPCHRIIHELLTDLQFREASIKSMRHAGVEVKLRLNATLTTQDLLEDEPVISNRIQSANLEVRWWESLVAAWPEEGREKGVLWHWIVRLLRILALSRDSMGASLFSS